MKLKISKEWCIQMAHLEDGAEIGVGPLAIDPVFPTLAPSDSATGEVTNIAFGRFVRLMRRSHKLSLEQLAEDAKVDIEELVEIEDDVYHQPDIRTVHQLANVFHLPRGNLLQIAGLTAPKNDALFQEAVKFAARSDPLVELTHQERVALEAFVAVLSEQK